MVTVVPSSRNVMKRSAFPLLANKQRRRRGKGVSGSGRRRRRLIPDQNGTAVLVVPSVLVGDRGKVADRTEQRWIERREEADNRLDRAERSLIPVCCVAPPPAMGVGITNRLPPVTDPLESLSPWAAVELKPSLAFPLVANCDSILAAKTEPPPCALSLSASTVASVSLPPPQSHAPSLVTGVLHGFESSRRWWWWRCVPMVMGSSGSWWYWNR
ncbi:hypothetical protein RIF29_35392 [Crotalaria pallida]|uniref:Uncharacterized protein n=1 Tax=Crotalaria pallida TaxID=3830 RepID=A0AAN9ECG1_CROPI